MTDELMEDLEFLVEYAYYLRDLHGITEPDPRVEEACERYMDTLNACFKPEQFTPEMNYILLCHIRDAIKSVVIELLCK
jgi:hypothetical protein